MKRELAEKERRFAECSNSLSILSFKSQVESEIKQVQSEIDRINDESKQTGEKIATIRGQQDIANKLHLVDGKCTVCDSKVDRLNPLFDENHITLELDLLRKKTEQ